uniref:Uncharacterized protein n=1 Tax=Bacillus thuringiensis serovar chinensis CT-43 TaxID=541229 RepID=E7CGP0_BACTU|nr:hypothetical protein pBMB0558_00585 [Bacillus thuringiensis serovar chinensis CT-43]
MFVESLFDKNLNLDELIFYASMFFDIYEMEGTTFREFGESKLENINLSKVKIYKVCLDAIRSRHGVIKIYYTQVIWKHVIDAISSIYIMLKILDLKNIGNQSLTEKF